MQRWGQQAGRVPHSPPHNAPRPAFSLFVDLPLPPNMPTSLRLDKKLKDFLWRRAGEDHRNLSQMIVHILEMYRASFKPPQAGDKVEAPNDQG